MICHFKNWLIGWDEKINSVEGMHSKAYFQKKMDTCISKIDKFLNDTDQKATEKYHDPVQKGKALIKNQEKPAYKNLTEVRNELLVMRYEIDRLYDLQRRITAENFDLREKLYKKM